MPVETFSKGKDVAYDPVANAVVAIGWARVGYPTAPTIRQEFAIARTDMNGEIDLNFASEFGAVIPVDGFQTASFNQAPFDDRASDLILLPDGRAILLGYHRGRGPSPRSV